jgi:hypothetical protein
MLLAVVLRAALFRRKIVLAVSRARGPDSVSRWCFKLFVASYSLQAFAVALGQNFALGHVLSHHTNE